MLRFSLDGHGIEQPVVHRRGAFGFVFADREMVAEGRLERDGRLTASAGGIRRTGFFFHDGKMIDLFLDGCHHHLAFADALDVEHAEATSGALVAPMPGIVRSVLVAAGDHVDKGHALVIMEAMKMEHTIRAPINGVIEAVNCVAGAMVEAGTVLVAFEPEGT